MGKNKELQIVPKLTSFAQLGLKKHYFEMDTMDKTVFKKTQKNQRAYSLPKSCKEFEIFNPPLPLLRKEPLLLPEISEIDLTRHFIGLANRNIGIDNRFYPLGSCTMKFNPRINEVCAAMPAFTKTHPLAPDETVQGNLEIGYQLLKELCSLCGLPYGTLVPNAGAQGEFTAIQMIAAYHKDRGDFGRKEIIVPDNAHGTNSATAAMAGFATLTVRSNAEGDLDFAHLKELVSERTAGLMLTNPNTLGLFSSNIIKIAALIHEKGGLLYYDGANLNPLLCLVRPGEMGFDIMHMNLHKTFSTPHGGGGPGSGPVLCNEKLKECLPIPWIEKKENGYRIRWKEEKSIGQIASFHGNFAIYLCAYLYIKLHGRYGLRRIAEASIINANYLKGKLAPLFTLPFSQPCMHEFVVQADSFLGEGVRALDIAKRLLDYGVHSPTIYFPLIIKECMLIEPTESESKETLDAFIYSLQKIIEEIKSQPALVKAAPVSRLDEVRAAKNPIVKEKNHA